MHDLTWNYLTRSTVTDPTHLLPNPFGVRAAVGVDEPGVIHDPPSDVERELDPDGSGAAGADERADASGGGSSTPPKQGRSQRMGDARFVPWLALGLVGFGVLAELVARTDPRGLIGSVLGIVAVLIARFASTPAEALAGPELRMNRMSRNAAAVIGIGASLGLVWRATPTLRFLDLVAILVSVVLVSDVWLRASILVMRRVLVAIVSPLAGFFDAIGLGCNAALRSYRQRFGGPERAGLRGSIKQRSNVLGRVFAGLLLAVPIVVVLGALLASADAVFASFFQMPDLDFSGLKPGVLTIARIAAFALVMAAPIVAGAVHRPALPVEPAGKRAIGRVEALVVFAAVDVLFGLFSVAQLVTVGGGAKRVLTTSGLTYAEYARSGFYQLVAVSVLTLMVLGAMRAAIGELAASDRTVRILSSLTAVLTLGITFVALNRMSLYMRAYGLTVDRIVAQAGTITIGCVFLLVLFSIVRSRPGRDLRGWTTAGSIGVAALAILGLHVVNPSAWSMRDGFARGNVVSADSVGVVRNDRQGSTGIGIDNDSLPVVTKWLSENPTNPLAQPLRTAICAQRPLSRAWYQWERSASIASLRHSELCNVSL
jgi:hypothetical protein